MSGQSKDPRSTTEKQYLALNLLHELCADAMESVAEADDTAHTISNAEAFERAMERRSYTARELISIQAMFIGGGRAVTQAIAHHAE